MMGDLSEHFSRWEFADRVTGQNRPVSLELVRKLEVVRALMGGRPLRIVSGIRTRSHNAAVGGARNSQHLYGRAADVPYGAVTRTAALKAGFRGIGFQGPYAVHLDVRPGPRAEFPD